LCQSHSEEDSSEADTQGDRTMCDVQEKSGHKVMMEGLTENGRWGTGGRLRKVGVDRAGIAQMREAILRSRGLQRRLGKMRIGVVARHLASRMADREGKRHATRKGNFAYWCEACGQGFVHDFNRRQHLIACGGGGGCARLKNQGLYMRVAQTSVEVTKQGYRALAGGIDACYRHGARFSGRALRARGLQKSNRIALSRRARGGEVLAIADAVSAGAAQLEVPNFGGSMRWCEVAVESRAGFHTAWSRTTGRADKAASLASASGACCVAFGERLTPWVPPRVPGR